MLEADKALTELYRQWYSSKEIETVLFRNGPILGPMPASLKKKTNPQACKRRKFKLRGYIDLGNGFFEKVYTKVE